LAREVLQADGGNRFIGNRFIGNRFIGDQGSGEDEMTLKTGTYRCQNKNKK
jgi:hypothetical protein